MNDYEDEATIVDLTKYNFSIDLSLIIVVFQTIY